MVPENKRELFMWMVLRYSVPWIVLLGFGAGPMEAADAYQPKLPMEIRVLVIKYFPVKGDRINQTVTGDWGEPLETTRKKTTTLTEQVAQALQEGSRYHGYKDKSAKPSLVYKIMDVIEFLEPLPTVTKTGPGAPMTDYNRIMERVGIKKWVEEKGVKEVWLWGYHGGVVGLWESNMAGPFGDISNSNRDPHDLPVLKKTYTVYHYNYQRGASEAVEDHMHQIEAVLNFVDGRDRTPPQQWPTLLFWGKFVGSDRTNKIVHPGCGTGVIEGAVRYVIGERMDCGGMRWVKGKAEAILRLHCIEVNGLWDHFFEWCSDQWAEQLQCHETVQIRTDKPLELKGAA